MIIKYKYVKEIHFIVIFFAKKFVLSMIIRIFVAREPAKPLNDAQMCGSFLFYRYMATKIPFIKTYSTPQELVQLLKTRGMEITDEEKAQHYLSHIGYYRLSAYMYPLLSIPKEQNLFKQGVTFSKVMMLYRFDKKLRLLLFNEIEKIEVAVRCAIINFGTEMIGNPFWMTDANNFLNPSKFNRSIHLIEDELNHTKEDFINHFKETYTNQYPPSWMLTEILPFGVITNIYSNIKNKKIKKRIAQSFGLQVAPFESWLTIITVTRNSCCHHARVWNRTFSIRATMPIRMSRPWISLPTDPLKVYFDICIIKYFLDIISPNNDMLAKMQTLFSNYPEINLAALGFPNGWESEPLWTQGM